MRNERKTIKIINKSNNPLPSYAWLPEKMVYQSFEQEYDISGVVPYDVTKYYSREQLLDGMKEHIQIMLSLYEGTYEEQYLDENGKLNYVETI